MTGPPQSALPIPLLLVPVLSTLLGGWLALRARRYLSLLTALGAGLLLGTAFLDLLPEALTLARTTGQTPHRVLSIALLAFLSFLVLDTFFSHLERRHHRLGMRRTLSRVSGALLILHSFRDGLVIGAAYSASRSAGLIVALGIVAHDFGDGMNTVILSTAGEPPQLFDYLFLLADALAPLLGGLVTIWWVQSPASGVVLLAIAGGFFLQMSTRDLPPRGEPDLSGYPPLAIPIFLSGIGLIYVANLLVARIGN